MILSGAVEIGPAELALALVALLLIFVVPVALGVVVGVRLYRRRVPPEERTTGGSRLWGLVGGVAGFALILLVGALSELA